MGRVSQSTFRIPVSAANFAASTEGLTTLNQRLLRRRKYPPLYKSGVVYKKERQDTWRPVTDVLRSGWGDCEDLAAWRAAELRNSGEDLNAHVAVYRSGPTRYHAIVARGDGSTEDPSRRLGMGTRAGRAFGKLEGDDMQHDLEGDEFYDDLGDDEADLGDLLGHAMLGDAYFDDLGGEEYDLSAGANAARRARGRKMATWCMKHFDREAIGPDGAWVGIGEDPLGGNPRVTFDLYRSGRGWSGIVRIPLALRGRIPQAIIAKTTPTPVRRRVRRRRPTRIKRRRVRRRRPKRRKPKRSAAWMRRWRAKRKARLLRLRRRKRRRPKSRRRRRSRSRRRAAAKAINLAARISRLPGIRQLIPPQARFAFKVLKSPLGRLAKKGVGKLLSSLFS